MSHISEDFTQLPDSNLEATQLPDLNSEQLPVIEESALTSEDSGMDRETALECLRYHRLASSLANERIFYPLNLPFHINRDKNVPYSWSGEYSKRGKVLNLMWDLKRKMDLPDLSWELGVALVDRYWSSKKQVKDANLTVLAASCLYLGNIYTDSDPISVYDYADNLKIRFFEKKIYSFCLDLVHSSYDFRIRTASPTEFLDHYYHLLSQQELDLSKYLIYTALHSPALLAYPPSEWTACATWLAHLILTPTIAEDNLQWYQSWSQNLMAFPATDGLILLYELALLGHQNNYVPNLKQEFNQSQQRGQIAKRAKFPSLEAVSSAWENMTVTMKDQLIWIPENRRYQENLQPLRPAHFTFSSQKWVRTRQLSDGTYGSVHKGYDRELRKGETQADSERKLEKIDPDDARPVAIKKFFPEDEDYEISCSTLRELDTHLSIKHPYIVEIYDVFFRRDRFNLVMELCEEVDLYDYLKHSEEPVYPDRWIWQILKSTEYLQHLNYLQRDLKTSNLLLTANGDLKLTDFGLCRNHYHSKIIRCYTPEMQTLNYRAPEVLCDQKKYDFAVDMWSIACIVGEIYLRRFLFPGDNELGVLKNIFKILGSPKENDWPMLKKLKVPVHYQSRAGKPHWTENKLKERFEEKAPLQPSEHAYTLMNALLAYNPDHRWTVHQAIHFWKPYYTVDKSQN